jgi:hypothetical protein
MKILTVDIGGSKMKALATGHTEPRRVKTGKEFTPVAMIQAVKKLARDWKYEAVSIGFPGITGPSGPACEPGNLGTGWVGFDFAAAFECPVKIINDAAMQALGSYDGGRMAFLGLGTGVGGALIADRTILPMELGEFPWNDRDTKIGDLLSRRGLERLGIRKWRRLVEVVATGLMRTFVVDYVVLGGGNAKRLKDLPHGMRLGHSLTAFRGGFRLWGVDDVPVLDHDAPPARHANGAWRVVG